MGDLRDLKENFDLRALASRLLGKGTRHRAYDVYPCFKHSDSSPALTIYNHSFYCYECGIGGTVLDFLMEYKGIGIAEAIKEAQGEVQALPYVVSSPKAQPIIRTISMETVQENASNISIGLPYFESRQITDKTSYAVPLGVKVDYRSAYQLGNGQWVEFFARRYAVPNIFEGTCRAINYRRDDQSFLDAFHQHPLSGIVADDLRTRQGDNSDSAVLKYVSGAKYKQQEGSTWKPFNVGMVARRVEGKITYNSYPFILLHAEPKEFDTLAVMDKGYPCMGILATNELAEVLPKLFVHIPLIYIIRDADEVGLTKAARLQNILGRGTIIKPIEGKDSGETLLAGQFNRWMGTLGLEPILNGRS